MRTGMWRLVFIGSFLLGILGLGACGGAPDTSTDGPGAVTGAVQVNPRTVLLAPGGTQTFTATVTGIPDGGVAWTVDGIAGGNGTVGTVSGSGASVRYTAPGSEGEHHLTATSLAEPEKSGFSTISVRTSCAPEPTSSTVINVKEAPYLAKGDNSTNDTAALQRAVNAMAGRGGTVLIPSGTYLVDAVGGGLILRSGMTLRFETGATLKAIPNGASNYKILLVYEISDVNIVGPGILQGDRASHTGTGGEGGHGLDIEGSQRVVVENLTSRDCWGDGFYVGTGSSDILFCNVSAQSSRRSGLSITRVTRMVIRDSVFQGSHGTVPECGLNIEPNQGETVTDVQILGSTFTDNHGDGIAAGVPCAYSAAVSGVVIAGNTVQRNGLGSLSGSGRSGIEISKCSGTQITGNISDSNAGDGILLRNCSDYSTNSGANQSTVSGNTVSDNGRAGIMEVYCNGNTIASNSGSGNEDYGIHSSHCTNQDIHDNDPGLPVTYTP